MNEIVVCMYVYMFDVCLFFITCRWFMYNQNIINLLISVRYTFALLINLFSFYWFYLFFVFLSLCLLPFLQNSALQYILCLSAAIYYINVFRLHATHNIFASTYVDLYIVLHMYISVCELCFACAAPTHYTQHPVRCVAGKLIGRQDKKLSCGYIRVMLRTGTLSFRSYTRYTT